MLSASSTVSDNLHCSRHGRSHAVRVYLLTGYSENTLRTYPLIYMQDGRNLFFPEEAFGGAACLSSTFGYQDDLFARIAAEEKPPIRLYLDSGWPRDNFDATNAMRDLLVRRGFVLGQDLLQFSFPEGLHNEDSWAARIHVPFQFFVTIQPPNMEGQIAARAATGRDRHWRSRSGSEPGRCIGTC